MEVKVPNDLLRLFYQYGLQKIPVTHNGNVQGFIKKQDIVRFLSRSGNFERPVINVIDELMEPAGEDLFLELSQSLESGKIKGIPILKQNGSLHRILTPGLLDKQKKSEKLFKDAELRSLYEDLLENFPFPIQLSENNETVFVNNSFHRYREESWESFAVENQNQLLEVLMPPVLKGLFRAYENLLNGQDIELRNLIEKLEFELMKLAVENTDTLTEASRRVNLPRQTFNYHWQQYTKDNQENDK